MLDVQDTRLVPLWAADKPTKAVPVYAVFNDPRSGNISVKDRKLLQDAVDTRCDAFLTMERRLPTAAAFTDRRPACGLCDRPRTGTAEPFRLAVLLDGWSVTTRRMERGIAGGLQHQAPPGHHEPNSRNQWKTYPD